MKLKLSSYFLCMACLAITLSVYNGIREARTFRVPRTWAKAQTDWHNYRFLYEGKLEHVESGCHPWFTLKVSGKWYHVNMLDLEWLDPTMHKYIIEFQNGEKPEPPEVIYGVGII